MEVRVFQEEPLNMVEVAVEEHQLLPFLVREVVLFGVREAVEPEVDIPQETRLKPHLQVEYQETMLLEVADNQELMEHLLLMEPQGLQVLPKYVEPVVEEVEPRVLLTLVEPLEVMEAP